MERMSTKRIMLFISKSRIVMTVTCSIDLVFKENTVNRILGAFSSQNCFVAILGFHAEQLICKGSAVL